jgi:four helix bundle protein
MKDEGKRKKEEVVDLRQRTKDFALRIIRLYSSLPKSTVAQVIGKQLLRSGTSVGANYREAYRARTKVEFSAKAGIALMEIEESCYWLELLVDADLIPAERLAALQKEAAELTAIFITIVRKSKDCGERKKAD